MRESCLLKALTLQLMLYVYAEIKAKREGLYGTRYPALAS